MSSGLAYTLEQAEADLRNVYFMIRACRIRNWKHNNKAKAIKAAMQRMGIKRHELIDASYCLRTFDCKRCNKNANGIPCHEIGRRRAAGVTKRIEEEES